MPLIESISGIRGVFGDGLDPKVLVSYASAFGTWCLRRVEQVDGRPVVVVGRDARVTGEVCANLVISALQSVGCDVLDAGLSTTPSIEMGIIRHSAAGGIVLSASHNPAEWNALKLLNEKGEYLNAGDGLEVLALARAPQDYARFDGLGSRKSVDLLNEHIEAILRLPYIRPARIAARNFHVVVDAVNSVGGFAIPALLERLGVAEDKIDCINCEPSGLFAHNPEPLPEHLFGITEAVGSSGADVGLAVDPDVDRLALVAEGGRFIGEELTQVLAADFLFRHRPGAFVTNLSSSRLIEDIAARYGQSVYRAPVGEINVVMRMKEVGAVIGGEGNGGVILPELHYGRDGLVGTALILQLMADSGQSLGELVSSYPSYVISKNKISLDELDADDVLARVGERFREEGVNLDDGVKVDFEHGWVHLRKSNTEPIIRIYSEGRSREEADYLASRMMTLIREMAR